MQRLGFNVVRLGIEWQALEPGSGGPNQPQVCTPGAPGNCARMEQGGRRGLPEPRAGHGQPAGPVRHLHPARHASGRVQPNFRGEGAPDWAVCTDNVPIVPKGGRWSNNYSNPTLQTAVAHFWANDVVGNLQGNFDLVWKTVAQQFKNDPWVVGYDPYNEPFSTETQTASESTFTGQLECFYIGKAHTGFLANGAGALNCPTGDARQRRHPDHPVGRPPSPDLRGAGHLLGDRRERPFSARPDAVQAHRVQLPHLLRRPQPAHGEPDRSPQVPAVGGDIGLGAGHHQARHELGQPAERAGHLHERIRRDDEHSARRLRRGVRRAEPAGLDLLGVEVLRRPHGLVGRGSGASPTGRTRRSWGCSRAPIRRRWPATRTRSIFNPFTGGFNMVYAPTEAAHGVTTVDIAASQHYPDGWCSAVKNGRITSKPGAIASHRADRREADVRCTSR